VLLLALIAIAAAGTLTAQSFSPPVSYFTGDNPLNAAIGDFNGDGKLDMAVTNTFSNNITVLLNKGDGTGTFYPPVPYTADIWPTQIVTADFNNDGKLDLANANNLGGDLSTGSISILLGNGNGTFQAPLNYAAPSLGGFGAADLNSDGKLDLITASNAGSAVNVRLGNGNGTFQNALSYPLSIHPTHMVLSDFNGDGKFDLVLTRSAEGINSNILLGNGDGTFQAASSFAAGATVWGMNTSDLNGDNRQDLILGGSTIDTDSVLILLGNGNGTFQNAVSYPVGHIPGRPQLSDLNGDGKLDVTVINTNDNNSMSILRGNGNGTFQPAVTSLVRFGSYTPVVADFNNDGKPDLLIMDNALDVIDVRLNSPSPHTVAINATAGAPATVIVATFIDYDAGKTACSFTASINWGDGSGATPGTVVANGSGGFNIIGTHTYALTGPYNVNVQIADDSGNFAAITSAATVSSSAPADNLIDATAGDGQTTQVNNTFASQLQATVTQSGVPQSGVLVTFTAPPCGASGTFVGTGTATQSVVTDSNGVATTSVFTANAVGGSYLVSAIIGNGSPATAFALTNTKADQLITFGSLPPKTFGDPDFGVSATASSGLTVSFAASGDCTVNVSTVHLTGAGTCTITASQNGNSTYNPAPAVPQSFDIAKANQTITFGALANRTFGAPDFAVSATASSGLPVSFAATGNCTVNNPSPGTVHLTGAGSCTITATQAGNANYNSALPVPQMFDIAKASQTIAFGALSPRTFGDPDFAVSATASSGLPVSFAATGNCTVTTPSPGTVHITGAGSCTITASQAGNADYESANAPQILTIAKASTTTSVTSTASPTDFGQSVTFTATVTSGAGTPSGTVQFKDNGFNLGAAATLNASGMATFTTSTLATGSHTISADYATTANFLSSNGALSGGQTVKSQPSLSINDVSITEGDGGTRTLTFTVTLSAASSLTVSLNHATADGSASAPSDYTAITTTALTFNPGDTTKTISVTINGDTTFESNETFFVNLSSPANATIADFQGMGTILNDDTQGGFISFSAATYSVSESGGSIVITVQRTGNLVNAATVDYTTSGDAGVPCATVTGVASPKCDFTSALGTLRFAAGENAKTFTVLISQDSFIEGLETFNLTLLNPTGGAVLTTPATAMVSIGDDATESSTNSIDDASNFVRQNYHDFLNREPDASGLGFWTNQITFCSSDQTCIELRRINVSAAFFLSIEFQGTGYLVERVYKTSYGDTLGASTFGGAHQLLVPIVRFNEFLPDTQEIGQGVVVGQTDWELALENNKQAFTNAFVRRARFTTAFPTSLTPTQFVNRLFTNAGLPLSGTDYTQAINDFGGAGNTTNLTARASALRRTAENSTLQAQEFNRAFVLMQYFGYMRRNPNDPQDTDYTGYDFWLTKLNQFGGNFVNAEMVKAFINSSEYRQRFGQ
jgi:hypothetical protein